VHQLGPWVVVPAPGGLLVGVMARFGSARVRGPGIIPMRALDAECREPVFSLRMALPAWARDRSIGP